MRRLMALCAAAILAVGLLAPAAIAKDRPYGTNQLIAMRLSPSELDPGAAGQTGLGGGQFSKTQIEQFTCETSGDPTATVDMSCNTTEFAQDFSPDNEVSIAVDPTDPNHLVAGSNDYFYRFNNSTGARQVYVPTGFFTSFDGGASWLDGQIPVRSGNGAGDPAPAFDAKHSDATRSVVLMAQLENTGGQGATGNVSQGDVSVSRSTDGGLTWSEPVTVYHGTGTGIGPANQATFYDKEYITVDNNPGSDFYGRAYITTTRFLNGLHGSYAESPILVSYSDDGGLTWSTPQEISGSHPSCTFQSTGGGTDCDEDQFSIPEVASDGTLYVHFANFQNGAAWEPNDLFDSQVMVVKSTDGGVTFGGPVPAVQLEDGAADMPFSVIGRQTIWGHQIRWAPYGNISVDPTDPDHVVIVFADRGTPNLTAPPECFFSIGTAPNYDPCGAGPGSDTDVYIVESSDGGETWGARTVLGGGGSAHEWFPWGDHQSDGTFVAAWDRDDGPAATTDTFHHVLWDGGAIEALGAAENPDVSATHWSGQYTTAWPAACGGTTPGKDCNVFHGDYTGLAVGSDDSINVVWTGLNRFVTTPQIDFYTGEPHEGYAQDAMFARR